MSAESGALVDALRLADLLLSADPLPSFTGISTDSRTIERGTLYVAVRGSQADGHRFAPDAVGRGASAIVVESRQPLDIPQVVVRDGRLAALALARTWFGNPADSMQLIGVTGTNGKTTTTALVRHLFNARSTAGSIGTLGAFDGAGREVPSTAGTLTTPGPVDLQATFASLKSRGCTTVAMETSSHSLDQGRLDGLTFAAGIFTNLTRDHLDYHGTMESYLAAKLRLSALLGLNGFEIVNIDDPAWLAMPPGSKRLTFGMSPDAHVRATRLELGAGGSQFLLDGRFGTVPVQLPLLGDFNVSNALGAAASALALGTPIADVAARLSAAPQVPGRMEVIVDRPCAVLRDYAHTPDALERALLTLRPLTPGRLIVAFGCGGDRDRGKRPIMGRLAAELADLPVVTSDNPRTEDPDAIIDDIERGMGTGPRLRIADRRLAIAAALQEARPGDTLLLAGKGHETYQVIGTEKQPFDEREIVLAALGDGMSPWTAQLVQHALGLAATPTRAPWSTVSTDTRSLAPGMLFLALTGDRFDGHDYLAAARDKGATTAVVRGGTRPVPGLELLEVDDTLRAYGDLARARRRLVPGPVVCVTGNNGKTTVKEMVAAVLRTRYRVHATRANNNNLVGVPLTIIEAPDDVEALVIEGGGNVPGELPRYREIIEPSITVATNATEGHLEGYGSLEAIVADTVAVTAGVPLAVVGMEPPSLAAGAREMAGRVVTVGWSDADRVPEILDTDALARPRVRVAGVELRLPLAGRHQALNAEFAMAVAEACGVSPARAAGALAEVTVPGGRSELSQEGGLTILNDSYNANPHSFGTSIATAAALRKGRRLVFVAGSMRELGDDADRLHREVAELLIGLNPELIAAVGDFVPAFAPWSASLGDRLVTARDSDEMGPRLAARLAGDEVVVLKGSRGAALERILPAITGRAAAPH